MNNRLWVLVGLSRTAPRGQRIVRFGPTSEQPRLLYSYNMRWPSGVDLVTVLPVMPGSLLRVTERDIDIALKEKSS